MASSPSLVARIASRLLLGWMLLIVAGAAMATGNTVAADYATPPSQHGKAFAEPGTADRDDASCSKAPSIQRIQESDFAKAEAEPELSLDSIRLARCALAPRVPDGLHDAACVVRRNTPLGRGPPRLT